jgi:hypothetical protein
MLKDLAGATHKSIKLITAIRRACNDLDSTSLKLALITPAYSLTFECI